MQPSEIADRRRSLKIALECFQSVRRVLIEDCDYFRKVGNTSLLFSRSEKLANVCDQITKVEGELSYLDSKDSIKDPHAKKSKGVWSEDWEGREDEKAEYLLTPDGQDQLRGPEQEWEPDFDEDNPEVEDDEPERESRDLEGEQKDEDDRHGGD